MPSSQYQYSFKFFRGTTGAYVVADATPDADRTLRLQSTVHACNRKNNNNVRVKKRVHKTLYKLH
jgi:hypothetical protein